MGVTISLWEWQLDSGCDSFIVGVADCGCVMSSLWYIGLPSDWTELFPYDYRDERMMRELRDATKRLATLSPVSLDCGLCSSESRLLSVQH